MALSLMFMGIAVWFLWLWAKRFFYDVFIFIDKSNRWVIHYDKIVGESTYDFQGKTYFIKDDSNILNKGREAIKIRWRKPFALTDNSDAPLAVCFEQKRKTKV